MALKENSKRILDIISTQTEKNATKAYKEVHTKASDVTARTNVHQLLQKPAAQTYLQKHIDKSIETKVRILDKAEKKEDDLQWQTLANTVSEQVLDRQLGKATQRVEQTTTGVTLTIDLTHSLGQNPTSHNN